MPYEVAKRLDIVNGPHLLRAGNGSKLWNSYLKDAQVRSIWEEILPIGFLDQYSLLVM